MNLILLMVSVSILCAASSVSWAAMTLQSYSPSRHDRFYNPQDPSKAFIGDPYDWSGVGRSARWATMISPSYFLSATHYHPDSGPLYFYNTNDPSGPLETRALQSGVQIAGTDLWLGKLTTPVSADIAKYPILSLPYNSAYDNLSIFTFGLSNTSPSQTSMRLGRNNIDPRSYRLESDDSGSTGQTFRFDFDSSGAQGADESYLQSGDSGAPSFVISNGTPALVGIHWFIDEPPATVSGDTFVSKYIDQINAAMLGERVTVLPVTTLTWDGNGDGQWNSTGRWTGGVQGTVPTDVTRAIVPANTVAVIADGIAQSILIRNGGRLIIQQDNTLTTVANAELDKAVLEIAPAGILHVGAEFSMKSNSQVISEIGPAANGQIVAAGGAAFGTGSSLALRLVNRLSTIGDMTRTIVSTGRATGINGSFAISPKAGDHLGYGVFVTDQGANRQGVAYHSNSIQVDLFQAAPGDTDGDRDVDASDIQRILRAAKFNQGTSGATWLDGDMDADQDVDAADIQSILAAALFNHGPYAAAAALNVLGEDPFRPNVAAGDDKSLAPPYLSSGVTAVIPEPSSGVILAAGALVLWLGFSRRRPRYGGILKSCPQQVPRTPEMADRPEAGTCRE